MESEHLKESELQEGGLTFYHISQAKRPDEIAKGRPFHIKGRRLPFEKNAWTKLNPIKSHRSSTSSGTIQSLSGQAAAGTAWADLRSWSTKFVQFASEELKTAVRSNHQITLADVETHLSGIKDVHNELIDRGDHGDMETLAAWIMDAKVEQLDEDDGVMAEELRQELDGMVHASANFMLNVSVICTLLVSIQITLLAAEASPHPLLAWLLAQAEKAMWGTHALTTNVSEGFLLMVAQQLASLWMLSSVLDNLSFICTCAKTYGALMYWCADFDTRVWYSRTWNVQEPQGHIWRIGRDFCTSLVPYFCITRGPVVAAALYYVGQQITKHMGRHVKFGASMIMLRQAMRVVDGSILKPMFARSANAEGAPRRRQRNQRSGFGATV
jgi:hypothetical protein